MACTTTFTTAAMDLENTNHHEQRNSIEQWDANMPTLRFSSGDVVVKLGVSPKDWLLVHQSVIEAAMPTLAPVFRPEWKRGYEKSMAVGGEKREVFRFGLKFVDETFFLEGEDFTPPGEDEHRVELFHNSAYGGDGWPQWYCGGYTKQEQNDLSAHAHKILFAMVYSEIADHEVGWQYFKLNEANCGHEEEKILFVLVGSYAEYYGCLHRVAPLLVKLLLAQPEIWKWVAKDAGFYLRLAIKLQHHEMYFDAVRHLIGATTYCRYSAPADYWRVLAEVWDISEKEAQTYCAHAVSEQRDTINLLESKLMRLQLSEVHTTYSCQPTTIETTFLNALSQKKKGRSDYTKARERQDFMARSIFGQWFAQQRVGEFAYWDGKKPKAGSAGPLPRTLHKILTAAESDDPSKLFGFKAAGRISSIFKMGSQFNSEKRIQKDLDNLVRKAAEIVRNAFPETMSGYVCDGEDGEGREKYTHRSSKYDSGGEYFTYMPLDESEVPWDEELEREGLRDLPIVDMDGASVEFVKAMGTDKEEDDSKAGDDIENSGEEINSSEGHSEDDDGGESVGGTFQVLS